MERSAMASGMSLWMRVLAALGVAAGLALLPGAGSAGERLLATGGLTQMEGSAGGGIVPWALIAGYGTRDEVGLTAFHTHLRTHDFRLQSSGMAMGFYDRFEVSLAKQRLALESTAPGESITQEIVGIKLKLAGDAVFDQDRLLPQIAVGVQYKNNRDFDLPRLLGAKRASGVDYYVAATK